jgi:outer membrane protein assembly factor BamB
VQQWTVPSAPIGAPAVGPDGTVYVVDVGPGLSALAPDGTTRWRFPFEGRRPTSGPVVGPDGTIYFTRVDLIQAVGPDGQAKWLSYQVPETVEQPPRFGPEGDLLLLGSSAFVAIDGTRSGLTFPVKDEMQFMQPRLATGADGELYLLAGNNAVQWRVAGGQAEVVNAITWELGGFNVILPSDLGIGVDGSFWIFYGFDFTNTRLVWLDQNSRVLASIEVPLRGARLLGIDGTQRAFVCSAQSLPNCMILDKSTGGATWEMTLPEGRNVVGGAIAPGRLYIATGDGWLHALGD